MLSASSALAPPLGATPRRARLAPRRLRLPCLSLGRSGGSGRRQAGPSHGGVAVLGGRAGSASRGGSRRRPDRCGGHRGPGAAVGADRLRARRHPPQPGGQVGARAAHRHGGARRAHRRPAAGQWPHRARDQRDRHHEPARRVQRAGQPGAPPGGQVEHRGVWERARRSLLLERGDAPVVAGARRVHA